MRWGGGLTGRKCAGTYYLDGGLKRRCQLKFHLGRQGRYMYMQCSAAAGRCPGTCIWDNILCLCDLERYHFIEL